MPKQLQTLIFVALFFLVGYLLLSILTAQLSFFGLIQVLLILTPFVLIIFSATQSVWMGLMLGALPLFLFIPVPILKHLSASHLIAALIILFVIAQTAMQMRRGRHQFLPGGKLILVAGVIILLRFLYDRPGSARLGGSGGAGEAVEYVMGGFIFWAMALVAARPFDLRRNLKVMILLGSLALVLQVGQVIMVRGTYFTFHIFNHQMWFLSAFALGCVYYLRDQGRLRVPFNLLLYGCIGLIFIMSMLSAHRSRPLIALSIVLTISWVYHSFKKNLAVIVLAGLIFIGGVAIFYPKGLPARMQRSLSTIIRVDQTDFHSMAGQYNISYEVGWGSNFRTTLYRHAWKRLKSGPIAGSGFAWSMDAIMAELSVLGGEFRGMGALALAGGYHNSILTLAVFCGLPCAVLFTLGMILLGKKFLWATRNHSDPLEKLLSATIIGFFVASLVQLLINGFAFDFFVTCCLLGVMNGLLVQNALREKQAAEEEAESPDGMKSALPIP